MINISKKILGKYGVLSTTPIAVAETAIKTNTRPIIEAEILTTPDPQAEAAMATTRRPKQIIKKKRNITLHPMQQVMNNHEVCLKNVAASNNNIAQALLVLSSSIARVKKRNKQSAVFNLTC
jgi:hypothetical protein